MTDKNDAALPFVEPTFNCMGTPTIITYTGLTKREYFASMAMQGLMAVPDKGDHSSMEESMRIAAEYAVMAADALINELNKTK